MTSEAKATTIIIFGFIFLLFMTIIICNYNNNKTQQKAFESGYIQKMQTTERGYTQFYWDKR